MNEDMISMTVREQRRLQLLTRVVECTMTLTEAAEVMGLSLRQARRLKGGLVRDGAAALVHGNRGTVSRRRTPPEVVRRVVAHYRDTYQGCNVQHFTELLDQREDLHLGVA